MTRTHTPRPTDLVALVSFDGEVYENQAVTRERLGKRSAAPHALAATVQQWLGRGRHVWIDVRGRQIHGIATARALASQRAWEIDTLVDAGGEHDGVITSLLTQASESAAEARVSQLLLRMHANAPALPQALRAGFVRAAQEDLWSAERSDRTDDCDSGDGGILVREAEKADRFALFQLYNRALPIGSRQAIAMTFEEWRAVQERRWLGRGGRELVACEGDKIRAVLQLSPGGQFTLLVEPGAAASAEALYTASRAYFEDAERVLALQPACAGTPAALLRSHGYQLGDEYVLLARRTTRPVMEAIPHAAGRTVPTRG